MVEVPGHKTLASCAGDHIAERRVNGFGRLRGAEYQRGGFNELFVEVDVCAPDRR
jgi:hypothetical protein